MEHESNAKSSDTQGRNGPARTRKSQVELLADFLIASAAAVVGAGCATYPVSPALGIGFVAAGALLQIGAHILRLFE